MFFLKSCSKNILNVQVWEKLKLNIYFVKAYKAFNENFRSNLQLKAKEIEI